MIIVGTLLTYFFVGAVVGRLMFIIAKGRDAKPDRYDVLTMITIAIVWPVMAIHIVLFITSRIPMPKIRRWLVKVLEGKNGRKN